jgi:hypothetical protein
VDVTDLGARIYMHRRLPRGRLLPGDEQIVWSLLRDKLWRPVEVAQLCNISVSTVRRVRKKRAA